MTREEFIRLVGTTLYHVTLQSNLAGISARGLMRPAEAARQAGFAPGDVALRETPETIVAQDGPMTLNHQRFLLAGQARAQSFLSSGSLRDWAMQLDERVFFWPRRMRESDKRSFGEKEEVRVLQLDAGAVFAAYADHLDLSPINSGTAQRRPVRRGPWLYVPATASVDRFRTNRMRRDLVKTPDRVAEISLRCDIPEPDLSSFKTARSA